MIKNIIFGIITIIVLYCLWWVFDRDNAMQYLPRAFQPEDVDTAIDSSGEITKKLFDLSREYGSDGAEIIKNELQETRKEKENMSIENKTVIINTSHGNITIELFADLAPSTVQNFVTLINQDFYVGTRFHRIVDGFMIQGGDPLSATLDKESQWGTGGPGYQFQDEIHDNNYNKAGTIAMANSGPNTNGSQFFINVADNHFLDKKHTVFGRVTDGMDTVLAISKLSTNQLDRPIDDVIVNSLTIK